MKHVLALTAVCWLLVSLMFVGAAQAKKPANHELMVACNKGWGTYHEANPGVTRKGYLSDCLSGKITPPAPKPEPAETRRR